MVHRKKSRNRYHPNYSRESRTETQGKPLVLSKFDLYMTASLYISLTIIVWSYAWGNVLHLPEREICGFPVGCVYLFLVTLLYIVSIYVARNCVVISTPEWARY